jgi:hypothetical protein
MTPSSSLSDRAESIRRLLRPLNLILIHQGLWALVLLLSEGPRVTDPGQLPWDWWAVRAGSAALAVLLALLYMRRLPDRSDDPITRILPGSGAASLRAQVAFAIIVLPLMLAIARLATEPGEYALKVILFGAVDALAYQVIAFGVARPLFERSGWGNGAALGAFALSWALRDLILAIVGDSVSSVLFSMMGGAMTGLLIGLASIGLRKWPGGFWTAWAAQWLVVSLIAGFV